jgi:hypothetical protein
MFLLAVPASRLATQQFQNRMTPGFAPLSLVTWSTLKRLQPDLSDHAVSTCHLRQACSGAGWVYQAQKPSLGALSQAACMFPWGSGLSHDPWVHPLNRVPALCLGQT